jgi:dethiobiotin synthetase
MNFFVTAIGTDSGKTLVSAIITQMLNADYWKPIQAGFPTDTDQVRNLVSNPKTNFHQEAYLLNTPASPHAAAALESISIEIDIINLPETKNALVIEGAGGCLVPLNDQDVVIDIAAKLKVPVVVVANLYLGSINHTLLTAEALKSRNIEVKGVVFNGDENAESERIILLKTGWKCLLRIPKLDTINSAVVSSYAEKLKKNWE